MLSRSKFLILNITSPNDTIVCMYVWVFAFNYFSPVELQVQNHLFYED